MHKNPVHCNQLMNLSRVIENLILFLEVVNKIMDTQVVDGSMYG